MDFWLEPFTYWHSLDRIKSFGRCEARLRSARAQVGKINPSPAPTHAPMCNFKTEEKADARAQH
ncbi:hypothetical protein N7537_000036 [Penicillium hordei]|uniref:Uncharacterized protein n=1 Tax=Penicillium hordei TaxID=40994 RepID=A0AAD6EE28_9EURO|nr:uncharacterized protein N7537_000036 [Penicillium hordei]KAJ5614922.1 hypothetical protein N7537_000036 [Penicillium hordei]